MKFLNLNIVNLYKVLPAFIFLAVLFGVWQNVSYATSGYTASFMSNEECNFANKSVPSCPVGISTGDPMSSSKCSVAPHQCVSCNLGAGQICFSDFWQGTPVSLPTLSIDANGVEPLTVTEGDNVTINWTVSDADSCTASHDWSGAKSHADGSYSESLGALSAGSYKYTLSCSNAGGSVDRYTHVTVNSVAKPSVTISLTDYDIPQNGNAEVTWTVTGSADTCTASGDYSGWDTFNPSKLGGTQSFGPINMPNIYEFSIECSNAAGSSGTQTVYLKVGPIFDPPACPLTPQAGRQIVDWSTNSPVLYSNQPPELSISKERSITLVDGQDYEVTVVAYDGSTGRAAGEVQTDESIFIRFKNGASTVYETGATSDIPDGVEQKTVNESVGTFTMAGTADSAVAVHAAWWDDTTANSVRPVCAAIDEVTAAPPAISVTSVPPFGDVQIGSTATGTFVVENTGGGTLTVDANPVISGAYASTYTCVSSSCSSAQSIDAGKTKTYTVEYSPTTVSDGQTASLELTGTFSKTVTLTGNGKAVGPPLPTVNFTSSLAVSINEGQTTDLKWASIGADVDSCKIEELVGGVPTGNIWKTLPQTGTQTVSPTVDSSYRVSCSNSSGWTTAPDDVVVTVNEKPVSPSITPDAGNTNFINDAQIFSILSTDPENEDIYYEVDWDNNGIGDVVTGNVVSGTPVNVNNTWATANTHNFQVRAVDISGNKSNWSSGSITTTAPLPATADLKVSIDGGPWQDSVAGTINTSSNVRLQWSSNQLSCTGTGFNTGGAPNNLPGLDLGSLTAGTHNFDIDCAGATDPIVVDVIQLPNLTVSLPVETPSAGFDVATGNYDFINVTYQIETFGADVGTSFDISFEIDKDGPGVSPYEPAAISPLTLPGLTTASPENGTATFTDVPFGTGATVRAIVDTANSVTESNEGDNEVTLPVAVNPPNLDMSLGLDPSDLVRGGGSVDIDYDTVGTFSMNCTLSGPGITTLSFNPLNDGPTGSLTAEPIVSKSIFTLECEEPLTGAVFIESAIVETTGAVQEI